MSTWQKLVRSGSNAELQNLFVENSVTASAFVGNGSALTGIVATSASYAATGGGIYGGSGTTAPNVQAIISGGFQFKMPFNSEFGVYGDANYAVYITNEQTIIKGLKSGDEFYIFSLDGVSDTAKFFDGSSNKFGIQYGSDYGSFLKSNDRSIADVGTIRTYLTSSYAISASYAPGSPSVSASFANTAMTASYFQEIKTVGLTIDGGGSTITTGIKGDITIPFNGYINAWYLTADQAGSIVIDVWKDVFANFPPTVLDSIAGSEKPTLSAAASNSDTNLTTWTKTVSSGDVIRFNVDSVSTVTRVNLILKILT